MPTAESSTMSRRDQRRSSSASTGIGRATAALTAGRQALRRPPSGPKGISAGSPAGAGTAGVSLPGGPAVGAPQRPSVSPSGPGGDPLANAPTGDITVSGMPGVSVQPRMPMVGGPPPGIGPAAGPWNSPLPMPGGPGIVPGGNAGVRPMLPNEPSVGAPGVDMRAITGGGLRAPGPGGQPDIQAIMQRLQALGIGPGLGSAFPGLGVGGTAQAPPQVPGGPAAGFRPDLRFMYA